MASDSDLHRWYCTAGWRKRRAHQLKIEPLCRMCTKEGKIEPAKIVDHVERHNGNYTKFVMGKLQSLCSDHHDKTKQQIEVRGFSNEIGADGFPVDERHPFYGQPTRNKFRQPFAHSGRKRRAASSDIDFED